MRFISTLATMAALAAIPSISQAQSAPGGDHKDHQTQAAPAAPGGMGMKGGAGGGMMGGDMGRMMATMHGGMMGDMPLQHVEGRLAFLKAELKITAAQEPQWTRFADTVRGIAKTAQGAMQPMMQAGAKSATTPERLGRYEKTLVNRLETVRVLKGAIEPLYTLLSDEQKKTADELLMGAMGVM